jgi:hypothetical protein
VALLHLEALEDINLLDEVLIPFMEKLFLENSKWQNNLI